MAGMDYYDGGSPTYQITVSASTDTIIWPHWVQGPSLIGTATYYYRDNTTGGDTELLGGNHGTSWRNWTVLGNALPVESETPEVRQARQAREAEIRQLYEVQQAEEKDAKERAERLLVEHLSPAQRAAYEKDRFFEVVAAKAIYRVYHDGGVRRLGEDGREVAAYCIHPDEAIPAGDLALAKKLLLESDEEAFRRIANESPVTWLVDV